MVASAPSIGIHPRRYDGPSRIAALPRLFASTAVAIPVGLGLLYLGAGFWLMLGVGFFEGDAISRTASAMNVVLGRDPHLASIGFIWNPLPSLLQIPLVLALDPLGLVYLASPVMSSSFAAGTLWVLDRLFRLLGVGSARRTLLLLLYGLNPLVVFYAANGLSEAPFIFFLVAGAYQYICWAGGRTSVPLMLFAVCTAAAFMTRYETLAFAAAAVFALILPFLNRSLLEPDRLEAALLTYLAPVTYTIGLWVFFNWLFMGDPLYFQRSQYGNLAQTTQFRTDATTLSAVIGSWQAAFGYGLLRWTAVLPVAPLVVGIALLMALVRREPILLGSLALAACIPLFHVQLLYAGTSYGWLRFSMYSIPFTFVLLPLALRSIRHPRLHAASWAASLALLTLTTPASLYAMRHPELGREEWEITRHILDASQPAPRQFKFDAEREIAAWVDLAPPDTVVLIDSFLGFPANIFSRSHDRFAITSDRDFGTAIRQPAGRVTHVLVPSPICVPGSSCPSASDQVVREYPLLWQEGAPWAVLQQEFGGQHGWRLYRVVEPAAESAPPIPSPP